MPDALSFTEIDGQHVELLPARTTMIISMGIGPRAVESDTGGNGNGGGNGGGSGLPDPVANTLASTTGVANGQVIPQAQ